jgi:hypothetical protein
VARGAGEPGDDGGGEKHARRSVRSDGDASIAADLVFQVAALFGSGRPSGLLAAGTIPFAGRVLRGVRRIAASPAKPAPARRSRLGHGSGDRLRRRLPRGYFRRSRGLERSSRSRPRPRRPVRQGSTKCPARGACSEMPIARARVRSERPSTRDAPDPPDARRRACRQPA